MLCKSHYFAVPLTLMSLVFVSLAHSQTTSPATPVSPNAKRVNDACIASKALLFCAVTNLAKREYYEVVRVEKSSAADGCTVPWLDYIAYRVNPASPLAPAGCLKEIEVTYNAPATPGAKDLILKTKFAASGSTYPDLEANISSSDLAECERLLRTVANSGITITPKVVKPSPDPQAWKQINMDVQVCMAGDSIENQLLDDVRALRQKFDSNLKAAIEAAIGVKAGSPEKKP